MTAKTLSPADATQPDARAAAVLDAIATRRSVRAFLPTPVPRAVVERILEVSARAPSGTNMQPWRVHVVTGRRRQALIDAVLHAHESEPDKHEREYKYYPDQFFEPYLGRRRKVGWDLYALYGIGKGENAKMHAARGYNYTFFGAPVGMICTIDRRLEIGSWLDYGMFLENICIAARGYGLDTCPQAAWASFHAPIRKILNIPDNEVVVCGMALGWADPDARVNGLQTERSPVSAFCTFHEE